jgi:cyclopropane-fatty-acyl-phospholipid synthase
MSDLRPYFEEVRAHYDLSNDFFFLFLDPSRVYSCAYFEREDMSLEEAQRAKIDLTLGKCDLRPGQRLLDVGCGWGAALRRAAERYGVHAIGLTLSKNQHEYAVRQLQENPVKAGSVEVRLQGWEEFDEPVDRIISIGAFEAFRRERYGHYFRRCRAVLPADGRMVLHTIIWPPWHELQRRGLTIDHEHVLFLKFINEEIFPGGWLPQEKEIAQHSAAAGFEITRVQSLQPHYAKTLDLWAAALEAERDRAIATMSREVYDRYMRYLTGCAQCFRSGHVDVRQFTLQVREGGPRPGPTHP